MPPTMTIAPDPATAPASPDRDGARARAVHRAARPLRTILRANAVFSLVCGLVALVAADRIAGWVGADVAWLVRLVGAGLVGYCPLLLAVAAGRPRRLSSLTVLVSVADFGWVVGTVALLATGAIATAGSWVLGLTGLVVLVFGVEQLHRRRALTRTLG